MVINLQRVKICVLLLEWVNMHIQYFPGKANTINFHIVTIQKMVQYLMMQISGQLNLNKLQLQNIFEGNMKKDNLKPRGNLSRNEYERILFEILLVWLSTNPGEYDFYGYEEYDENDEFI